MISEEALQQLLESAADRYDVPSGAVDRILAGAAETRSVRPRRRPRWGAIRRHPLFAVAGVIVVVLVLFVSLAFAGGSGPGTAGGGGGTGDAASNGVAGRLTPAAPELGLGSGSAGLSSSAGGAGAPAFQPAAPGKQPAAGSVPSAPSSTTSIPNVDTTRIVRTGTIDMQVRNREVSGVLDRVAAVATVTGGFVASSNTDSNPSEPNGQVVLRVPVANFDHAVADVRRLGKLTELTTNSQDVTGQYVDLSARLTALRATRSTYLTLLSRATTIGATLAVQQRIDDIQQQIEQLQGQRQLLANRAALSTLTVDVHGPAQSPQPLKVHHQSGWARAWHNATSRFNHGVQDVIGALGPLALALLVLVVVLLLGRLGYRLARRRFV